MTYSDHPVCSSGAIGANSALGYALHQRELAGDKQVTRVRRNPTLMGVVDRITNDYVGV